MTKHAATRFPDRKVSETFLHFAEPIIHDVPSEAPEHRAREALQVSFTVWNAVIFADVLHDHAHLDEIRRLTAAAGNAQASLFIEQICSGARTVWIGVAGSDGHYSAVAPFLPPRWPGGAAQAAPT